MTAGDAPDPRDDAALKARLAALSGALEASRQGEGGGRAQPDSAGSTGRAMNLGFRVMTEFVASVAVGGLVGWAIDKGLHSSPVGLIVFVALGTAAGFWSVYKIAAKPTGAPAQRSRGGGAD